MSKNTKDAKQKAAKKTKSTATDKKNGKQTVVTDVVEEVLTEPVAAEKKKKKPFDPKKAVVTVILFIFTLCLGVVSGYAFSKASLAKAEHSFLSVIENGAIAAEGGYDTSLINSYYDQSLLYIVLAAIGIAAIISIYGGRKRLMYLIEYALVNTAVMLATYFFILIKTPGFAAYSEQFNLYFWFILCGIIGGCIFADIIILLFSVLRFRHLENRGKVNEDGVYFSNLPDETEVFSADDENEIAAEQPVADKSRKLKSKKAA